MNKKLKNIFKNNQVWSDEIKKNNPSFFINSNKKQKPNIFWIGCADSRVAPTLITKSDPGDIFEHRNVSNLVNLNDSNFMTCLIYSVDVLKVKNIIICGHYNCGGVIAAINNNQIEWINPIKKLIKKNEKSLNKIEDYDLKIKKVVELNVIQQIKNLLKNSKIKKKIKEKKLEITGIVYDLQTGLLNKIK